MTRKYTTLSRNKSGSRRPNGWDLIFGNILASGNGVFGNEDNGSAEKEDCFRECVFRKACMAGEPEEPIEDGREFPVEDCEIAWCELAVASLASFDQVSLFNKLRPQSLVTSHQNE